VISFYDEKESSTEAACGVHSEGEEGRSEERVTETALKSIEVVSGGTEVGVIDETAAQEMGWIDVGNGCFPPSPSLK
jgi:hypothetical protein